MSSLFSGDDDATVYTVCVLYYIVRNDYNFVFFYLFMKHFICVFFFQYTTKRKENTAIRWNVFSIKYFDRIICVDGNGEPHATFE